MKSSDLERSDRQVAVLIALAMLTYIGGIVLSVVLILHGVSLLVILGVLTLTSLVMTWAVGWSRPPL